MACQNYEANIIFGYIRKTGKLVMFTLRTDFNKAGARYVQLNKASNFR